MRATTDPDTPSRQGLKGPVLAAVYVALAALPLGLAAWLSPEASTPWREAGSAFGLLLLSMMTLQFWTSGRFEMLSGRVGLDQTMGFHRIAAIAILALVILHPLGYVARDFPADPAFVAARLGRMLTSPRLLTGVLAAAAVAILVTFAILRTRPFVRYEIWRATHGTLALAAVGLAVHHVFTVGASAQWAAVWITYLALAALAAGAFLFAAVLRPLRRSAAPWTVETVRPLGARTWDVTLRAPAGTAFHFVPGQFVWMSPRPGAPWFTDHPFSIASSPHELPRLTLLIKEAGDYTRTLGQIPPGTEVGLDGPHGSFVLPGKGEPVLIIAGGVGIAPLLGILEGARASGERRPFRMLYCARRKDALVALHRLKALRAHLDISITTMVDETDDPGTPKGPLNETALRELLGASDPGAAVALICGPPHMMEVAADSLLAAGVAARNIHYERFDYGAGRSRIDTMRRQQALGVLGALTAAAAMFALR